MTITACWRHRLFSTLAYRASAARLGRLSHVTTLDARQRLLSYFLLCKTFRQPLRYPQLGTIQEELRFHSSSTDSRSVMGDRVRKHSPNDSYPTPTSTLQESTERILASHVPINTPEAGYELKKSTHVPFIARAMLQGLPSKYISQDASQPWLIFWILESFSILQVGLDPGNKQRSARSTSRVQGVNLGRQGNRHSARLSTPGWWVWRRACAVCTSVTDVCGCVRLGYCWATRTGWRLGRN